MSQEIKKIVYCPAGHSSNDIVFPSYQNSIRSNGNCHLCTKEHFIQEFKTWSSGNADIDEIIQEFPLNNNDISKKLQWIPYDNFENIEHIADGGHGSVYSAQLKNGIKYYWNFNTRDWKYQFIGYEVALKEIKDFRFDLVEFLEVIKTFDSEFIDEYLGISKNPSTQNYIIVMGLFYGGLHNFFDKKFCELKWQSKIDILLSITYFLGRLHEKNSVHCNLHSGNILVNRYFNPSYFEIGIDLSSCKSENDLIFNSNKNSKIYGSIPYVPPEVLRGNVFTREGDIYSFGGIMYEIVTAQRPFADQAHDTYLMIDICNGVRPKVPDFMLNWIPEWYSDLMYRCWSDNPSERPTAAELGDFFYEVYIKCQDNIVDDDVMQQLQIADENQKNISKSQKQELFDLFSHSSKLDPQSCFIGRYIYTLHGLHDLLEEIKSGKSSDPNLLLKSNVSTTSSY
ncbi:hypothetical protein Glove_155g9 [Diversispora epigaea]|uniref:Protein kinase domain-containing protein n=1 Tax=Diversispora epigaea TaxID=1348612 RepID=A0A397J1P3_9GLOM|nr:hypothetical protein Glove_155g9 [Diversispora epigaea]